MEEDMKNIKDMEDMESILKVMSFATSMLASALKMVKGGGYLQATCIAAIIDTLKEHDILNDSIDMAVSYKGRVIRKENADDHCE